MGRLNRILFFLLLGAASALWAHSAAAAASLESLRKQLETAAHLIEDSSAAKRVQASGNAEAKALREEARKLFAQAEQAVASGRGQDAEKLLADAKKTMFKAVQTAGSGAEKTNKAKSDYEAREQSVRALLKAQGRVADEKHAGSNEARLHREVEGLLEEAQTRYRKADYVGGKEKLDVAYGKLKVSIERMRHGEVLEHRVEFKSVEDEYKYYWGKTESQLEAIGMAANSVAGTSKEAMVKSFSDRMRSARGEAKQLADRGDFQGAVQVLLPIFQTAPYQLMSLLR